MTADGSGGPVAIGTRFSVVARSTLPEEIAARLLALIRTRELRPGDKLPSERTLAGMMDVSRPVLREALRALAIMRVVDIRQGSGTYVTSLEPAKLVSHLDLAFSTDTVALVRLVEARRIVEVGNARLAAARIDAGELARLETVLADLEATVEDAPAFSRHDIAFHDAVCAAARNFVLSQFMAIVDTLGQVSRERTGSLRAVREATLHDHRRILDALRAGDADAAASAMEDHLDHVERSLGASLAQADAAPAAPVPELVP